ncbi:hypothetical protein MVEN_00973200 [Mycena venus]|uniref:Lipid droplet-associated perilipin protein n=1 Tax=Mycena venus TaxID=2733690 RepID=A0A8H6YDM7_9AGAR|nr:hypothetical protein MVEN_00973200 [Mycena venus]
MPLRLSQANVVRKTHANDKRVHKYLVRAKTVQSSFFLPTTMASSVPMPSSSKQSSSSAPELTVLTRVASIPLIAWTINQVSCTLEQNRYTSSPYATAKGLSTSAYKYTEPFQIRLAPAITTVDEYANMACDVVESRFPYPFKAKPEEVADYYEQSRLQASKTIDEKVKTPAFTAACEVDKRFAPIVDYLESTAVTRLNTSAAPKDCEYQYQRVYVLSKNVTGQLYQYSNQTILVQRASQTADSITALASSANSRIHTLSNNLITDLKHLRASFTDTTTAAYHELNDCIGSMHNIVSTPNLTVNEKISRMVDEINFHMRPLLNRLPGARTPPTTSNPNGNGHAQ